MDWLFLSEITMAGLGNGALYALSGLALVLIYKSTRVINLAIGELLMMGAYFFFSFTAGWGLSPWLAVPLAILGGGLLGLVIERSLIRPMLGENPTSVFMVTIGLASVLVGAVELIWSPEPQRLPDFFPTAPIFVGEAFLSPKVAYSALAAVLAILAAMVIFRKSRGGVALRATAADQMAAYGMGINVTGVFAVSWALACAVAAGAGILVGAVGGISSAMGIFGLSVLVVVIVGGLDSIVGALIAGLLIGVIEAWAGVYLGGEFRPLATFTILALVLMIRPYGLFGTREIERL